MNSSDYVVWMHSNKVKDGCVLGKLEGMEKQFRLRKGVSLAGQFASNAGFPLHPDFPNNLVCTDSLMNSEMLIVGSLRLQQFLEKSVTSGIEFLPVAIKDRKGNGIGKDYSIVNLLDPIDCLDKAASGAKMSEVLTTNVDQVSRLVIKETNIPTGRTMFRIAGYPKVILVHRKLAEGLDQSGMTGFRWLELSAYPEI